MTPLERLIGIPILRRTRPLVAAVYLLFLLVAFGFEVGPQSINVRVAYWGGWGAWLLSAAGVGWGWSHSTESWRLRFKGAIGVLFWLAVCAVTASSAELFILALAVGQFTVLVHTAMNSAAWKNFFTLLERKPALLLVVSFAGVIAVGSLLLMLPSATTDHQGAQSVDAVFTATSATCVTGLIVLNTAEDTWANPKLRTFSRFGQLVILFLIQIGGLGIMTLSASLLIVVGRSLALHRVAALGDLLDESRGKALEKSVAYILKMTIVSEAIGTALLYAAFQRETSNPSEAFYQALFHSISAFCNAGFSLFGDSLSAYAADPLVSLTVSGLIIVGGLGYSVVALIVSTEPLRRRGGGFARWGLHAQMVVTMTVALLLIGWVATFYVEYDRSLADLDLGGKLLASFFQSVTVRTAGFNSVDLGLLHRSTMFLYVIMMFIGASPGGTGGGVKTTTVGVLFLAVRAVMYSRRDIEAWGRRIERETVLKAVSIITISGGVVSLALLALLFTEPTFGMDVLLFEVVSAFGTVGLSMGITPLLSIAGKVVIILLMFVGRLGPLTMALAIKSKDKSVSVTYPTGKIAVG